MTWTLRCSPATIRVKENPFFTDFLCTCLGSVANPTYSLSSSLKQLQTYYILSSGTDLERSMFWILLALNTRLSLKQYLWGIVRIESTPRALRSWRTKMRLQRAGGTEMTAVQKVWFGALQALSCSTHECGRVRCVRTGSASQVAIHHVHLSAWISVSCSGGQISHGICWLCILYRWTGRLIDTHTQSLSGLITG